MHDQTKAILQSLVTVAWADGKYEEQEKQMVDALLESFGATDEEAAEMRTYAAEKKTLEDVPLTDMSMSDRRLLLQYAVHLSWVDGDQAQSEIDFIASLQKKLNLSDEDAKPLLDSANERAKRLLGLLKD